MEEKSVGHFGCTPPPNSKEANHHKRVIHVQFLELDMTHIGASSCNTCMSVEDKVYQMVAELQPILQKVDTDIKVEKTLVTDIEHAKALRFKASPSIRIAGFEMIPTKGDIFGLGERYWEWKGALYPSPPVALFIDAVLRVYVDNGLMPDTTSDSYQIPDALKEYFTNPSVQQPQRGSCGCS